MVKTKDMTSKQRAELRSQAHSLNPVVMVGHEGITEGVIGALEEALTNHELVKVRFHDFKDMAGELSDELAQKTNSTKIAVTGFTAVFYRKNPEKRK